MKLILARLDPVQMITAHPDTLAQFATVLPKAEPRPGVPGNADLAPLLGLPLVPDPEQKPGYVFLCPFPDSHR
ncbi:hypothetical protein [Streptomyces sp. NBC_00557]|jgi:hypothetical protein|uniref:hypothetical protein n=1 Tax=Streptomyces sp. NBC_00557 TaxID=2975776 RepID=UPI002E7FF8E3|nr:hypothetical protein [Streptomyces sp. NBC_00557]WUC36366.1 hypothetical protein OG956_20155 [Streptomyces sp. NBC_00557]